MEAQGMFREVSGNLMIACVAAGAAAGCHSGQNEKEKAREDFREAWAHRTPPEAMQQPKAVIVAQGPSPLVYQVLEPCTVHIIDATTGAEIATAAAKKQGLVYVSEETGAFVNGDRVAPGPFNRGHRYAISVEVAQEQSWSSQRRIESAPKAATSQPGGR